MVSDWVAWVQGKAELCEFSKPCDCGSGISYLEDMVLGQVLIGLQNEEWLEKCLTMGESLDLSKLVKVLEGLEAGKKARGW